MREEIARIHFLLLPDFPLYALVPATDALRIANQTAGERLFDWSFVSATGGPVKANNGMIVDATLSVATAGLPQCVIVCSGNEPTQHLTKPLLAWLRRVAAHGGVLGALDTGAFALAEAGVLGGYRMTLHWEAIPAFRDAYPDIAVVDQIFVVDRKRMTAAGGVASLDLMLWLIEKAHGTALAQRVADGFVHGRPRASETPQLVEIGRTLRGSAPIRRCMALMKDKLAFPLPIDEVCDALSLSRRRLERLFKRETGLSPNAYYLGLRLEAARDQLIYTGNSIAHIAESCGFASSAHFCRAFRSRFNRTPSTVRQRFANAERDKFHPAGPMLTGAGMELEPTKAPTNWPASVSHSDPI